MWIACNAFSVLSWWVSVCYFAQTQEKAFEVGEVVNGDEFE